MTKNAVPSQGMTKDTLPVKGFQKSAAPSQLDKSSKKTDGAEDDWEH
jgi:hypothetical protein